jgi:hypothetical protein
MRAGGSRPLASASLLLCLTGACAGADPDVHSDSSLTFRCENGATFRVVFLDGQVRVATHASVYHLIVRPSSIGQKYSLGRTFLILDDDRAVLHGADGGPFRRCSSGRIDRHGKAERR